MVVGARGRAATGPWNVMTRQTTPDERHAPCQARRRVAEGSWAGEPSSGRHDSSCDYWCCKVGGASWHRAQPLDGVTPAPRRSRPVKPQAQGQLMKGLLAEEKKHGSEVRSAGRAMEEGRWHALQCRVHCRLSCPPHDMPRCPRPGT